MIRQLAVNDYEEWKKLRLEAVQSAPESFGESAEEVAEHDIEYFKSSLAKGDIFTYEKDGQMCGLLGIYTMQPKNMNHRAVIFGLFVKPEYRKQGIADELIKHTLNFAKTKKYRQTLLRVTTNNIAAVSLYLKHGFTTYGTDPEALLVNGKFHDDYLMIKTL